MTACKTPLSTTQKLLLADEIVQFLNQRCAELRRYADPEVLRLALAATTTVDQAAKAGATC